MSNHLINRLHFGSNAAAILKYLRSKSDDGLGPSQFSFNAIRLMPDPLNLPNHPMVQRLSLMNSDWSAFNDKVSAFALRRLGHHNSHRRTDEKIEEAIEDLRCKTSSMEFINGLSERHIFDQAVANYRHFGFFASFDWRLANWGTVADVCSVGKSTFKLPTSCIEFTTQWTPPIFAIQTLADTFPSVRFELFYRYAPDEPFTKIEFFPTVPFGY
jgi:hypothetical protein